MHPRSFALSLLVLSLAAVNAKACSSCGCTLNSDWVSQGLDSKPGFALDLRYDFIDQTALREGNGSATAPAIPAAEEVEQRTTNRYITATLGYNPNRAWGFSVVLPYLDRSHSTIVDGDTDITTSHTRSLGDIKVMARYQGFSTDGDSGLIVGLKLPTGSRDFRFNGGPQAGTDLDRSLQPGTGSTDLIIGGFRTGSLNRDWDWYAQGLVQAPVKIRDEFRPGAVFSVNGGFRYMALTRWEPQVQVNALERRPDGGANGDAATSGGRSFYVSPGLAYTPGKKLSVYGFVQLPVVQHVTGLQLAPRWSAAVGVSTHFN
ncbi:hypothetical protein EV700_1410 [Fluviicoccus keumensis]|uniref:Outer membrane beta-barrel porin/alpha-amylase n=1 Tax=Fluviicoccus keumensis TaxID=1435465 RepID=A0A4Q7ZAB7_9GAMM|nr:transporter [Fluviicoccus keumensis]RZU47021.1 hypothetical protein EV700_1410 [Fluviicoccus keumensis]